MRLKRWESPRRQGRNDKGRGGSARKRQLKKQTQMLRQKLKDGNNSNDSTTKQKHKNSQGKDTLSFPYFFIFTSDLATGDYRGRQKEKPDMKYVQ